MFQEGGGVKVLLLLGGSSWSNTLIRQRKSQSLNDFPHEHRWSTDPGGFCTTCLNTDFRTPLSRKPMLSVSHFQKEVNHAWSIFRIAAAAGKCTNKHECIFLLLNARFKHSLSSSSSGGTWYTASQVFVLAGMQKPKLKS